MKPKIDHVNIYNVQQYITEFFDIREFVSPRVYNKYKNKAWRFFDPRLLVNMYYLRYYIGRKITVNNWLWGGKFKNRGLRTNLSYIVVKMVQRGVLYLSGHPRGTALDFDVEGMTAFEVREWLEDNQDLLPFKFRLEKGSKITWVHKDVDSEPSNPHCYQFYP